MLRILRNRGVDGHQLYTDWHWGIEPTQQIRWDEHGIPDGVLVECGRMVELHYRPPGAKADTIIKVNPADTRNSHLAFDPTHKYRRLYILANDGLRKQLLRRFRQNPDYAGGTQFRDLSLADIARMTGGRHATPDYPKIQATPLGALTHVVYGTHKKGDGPSLYIHACGEESGIRPTLAVDSEGRPWICGGNYTSPEPGITD